MSTDLSKIAKGGAFRHVHSAKKKNNKKSSERLTPEELEADERFKMETAEGIKPPRCDAYGHILPGMENVESSSDEEDQIYIPDEALPDNYEDVPTTKESTDRLAFVNLPWKKMKASDIFSHIVYELEEMKKDPELLIDVTVYLSNFGKENPEPSDDVLPNLDEDLQIAIWRKREKVSMRRYFAIATFKHCDDGEPPITDLVYQALNDCEIGSSGVVFDLQVVPDDQDFSTFTIRDKATSRPTDWEPPEIDAPYENRTKPVDDFGEMGDEDRKAALEALWNGEDGSEDETQVAMELVMGNGSEDDDLPTREDMASLLEALNNEEEEANEEQDEGDFEVEFVSTHHENYPSSESTIPEPTKELVASMLEGSTKKDKKKKRAAAVQDEEEDQADQISHAHEILNDDRFADLFAKEDYGFDATDPKFKRTPAMDVLMTELGKKHAEDAQNRGQKKHEENAKPIADDLVEQIRKKAERKMNKK